MPTNTKTFADFTLITDTSGTPYLVGYQPINGVQTEIRVPYSVVLAAAAAAGSEAVPPAVAANVSPTKGSNAWLQLYAALPDPLIVGAIARDSNGAITTAAVVWPDGTAGTFTTLVASTAFPGAVDSYAITYGSPATKTATQPTVTRDSTTGAATARPAIIIT